MKLFTLGDSISQGLMSLGVARTHLAYSTWIARALGVDVGDGFSSPAYRVPDYPAHGLLLDLEVVLRRLYLAFGSRIEGLEWASFVTEINRVLDVAEDHYERGEGAGPYRGGSVPWFHNVSVYGFDVADAWLVTPALCEKRIAAAPGAGDGFLHVPSASFYRTALRVLNPSRDPRLDGFSQLDWLAHHARGEGVESLLLWLGPNNAVGSAILLSIAATEDRPDRRPVSLSFDERTRAQWNLWMPDDFVAEYGELLDRIDTIMRRNEHPGWRVFVANVPHVTIAPIAAGVGDPVPGSPRYFPYYTYPPLAQGPRLVKAGAPHLTEMDARFIDATVDACNAQIAALIEERNARHRARRYHLVDISGHLDRLAYRRSGGEPTYEFPAYFKDRVAAPMDTRYYHVDRAGRRKAGGIVSLDGVHPSVIGQGLLAHEFLKVMKAAGVEGADPDRLPWPRIVASDTLYQDPIPLMEEVYEHEELAAAALAAHRHIFGGFQGRRGSIKDF
ncbi:hypothetical protein [Sorangium sp. So ce406]|uniref:hypothetical protein n=1 Tax=Sorangium sp. So ce406 TaxID=3133311 RepID=UPI003F5AE026